MTQVRIEYKICYLARNWVKTYENGRMNPTLSTLEKIAGALGISSTCPPLEG